jgi:hypothetical protein
MSTPARTCVVVCYWVGESRKHLFRLLRQMLRIDAGTLFGLVIVVNGGDERPLKLPERFAALNARIINRVNRGYNIEAWDVGWRSAPEFDYYLFLQSECFLKRENWVADYEFRMSRDPGVGLLGEFYGWEQKTWQFIREATDRDLGDAAGQKEGSPHPIDVVQSIFRESGVPLTELGTHIPSVICCSSRKVLLEVGGFPLVDNPTYWRAVGSEVAFSRSIEAKGYRLSRVRDRDFSVIGHRQYTWSYKTIMNVRAKVRMALRNAGLRCPRR